MNDNLYEDIVKYIQYQQNHQVLNIALLKPAIP